MRLLTRYVLREVASYALLGAVLFTFVLFIPDLPKVLEMVVRDSASLTDVLRLLAYNLPYTLTVTIPTAVLAGILLGLSRLAADSEVTAMRACGIGALSFVRIVSILAFAALGLGLLNALYFAPSAAANLLKLEDQLKTSQASFEVQPRVFFEDLKNYVLYVQDVSPEAGVATWRHVFLADLTQPANPNVTTADRAIAFTPGKNDPQGLRLHLLNGSQHQISPTNPNSYNIGAFTSTDDLLQFDSQDDTHISRVDTPLHALSLHDLVQRTHSASPADARSARIELNIRFSYPLACIVLMLIGVPLGLSSKRGGKSTGVVLTLFLVFTYYLLSNVGVAFAKSGKLSPILGVWAANFIFTAFGLLLLQQLAGTGLLIHFFNSFAAYLGKKLSQIAPAGIRTRLAALISHLHSSPAADRPAAQPAAHSADVSTPLPRSARLRSYHPALTSQTLVQRMRSLFQTNFPLLLDEYVLRAYAANLVLSLTSFALLFLIFTFFELIGDIIHNGISLLIVGDYLFNLLPYIVSAVTPLCSLLAVLITFGALNRSSELTAMKATGISLYRVVAPVVVLAAILSVLLFAFNESYLPAANRRQEALRAEIKGKPAQTFLRPDRKWISGQSASQSGLPVPSTDSSVPDRIFYYQAFDRYSKSFANLTVFEFDPKTFTLVRRIFAANAHWDDAASQWVFVNGWQRTFANKTVASYQTFSQSAFPEIHEQPSYFIKEYKQSQEMNYNELTAYIADLSQSGVDTIPLRVQLQRKLADPAITLVMAILAVPFALSMGKRGGLAGIAIAIAVAISYFVVAAIFSSLGDIDTLPPMLAAWSPDILFAIAGSYLLLRTPT